MAGNYYNAILALSPSAYWPLSEASGATTFADVSGNGLTATGEGTYLAGMPGVSPSQNQAGSVCWAALGDAVLASGSTFDYTSVTAFSFVCTFSMPPTNTLAFLYTKLNAAATRGHYLMMYPNTMEFGYLTDASNRRKYLFPVPGAGIHQIVVSFGGSAGTAPNIYVDGVLQTLTTNNGGTPTTLTTTDIFHIGGIAAGSYWNGFMQDVAFFSGAALTANQIAALWAAHQLADRSNATPIIVCSDNGSSDIGDLPMEAIAIFLHLIGRIRIILWVVDCGDDYTAPSARAKLDHYGLTNIPVCAYKNSDEHVGGDLSTSSRKIRDTFRPGDTRSNPIYSDPPTGFAAALTPEANNSVLVYWGGFANSIAQFLNASSANKTLWNNKVKKVLFGGGVWPNSSDAASPPGPYPDAGLGDWDIGGSDLGAVGNAEAQAAVDLTTYSTTPEHYWNGTDICGNVGSIGTLISSGLPSNWSLVNPFKLGMLAATRTAWDPVALIAFLHLEWFGASNQFYTTVRIATPSIVTSGARVGHNTSTPGSSNNSYLVPNTSVLTITQWRTIMAMFCNVLLVEQNNTTRAFRLM